MELNKILRSYKMKIMIKLLVVVFLACCSNNENKMELGSAKVDQSCITTKANLTTADILAYRNKLSDRADAYFAQCKKLNGIGIKKQYAKSLDYCGTAKLSAVLKITGVKLDQFKLQKPNWYIKSEHLEAKNKFFKISILNDIDKPLSVNKNYKFNLRKLYFGYNKYVMKMDTLEFIGFKRISNKSNLYFIPRVKLKNILLALEWKNGFGVEKKNSEKKNLMIYSKHKSSIADAIYPIFLEIYPIKDNQKITQDSECSAWVLFINNGSTGFGHLKKQIALISNLDVQKSIEKYNNIPKGSK